MNQELTPAFTSTANGAFSPAELSAGEQTFHSWYHLANGGYLSATVSVFFQDLKNAVSAFMQAQKLKEADVACRFIHRFDTENNSWFPTLELCRMVDLNQTDPYGRAEYRITGYNNYRYDLKNGLTPTQFTGDYDPVYFSHVYYPDNLGIDQPLVVGTNVQSVTFPWMREILRLCQENNLEGVPEAKLMIQSISCTPAHQQDSLVPWPHTIAFYMRNAQGQDCLGQGMAGKVFYNQAADVGTSCPTKCNTYLMPQDLPQ